MKDRPCPSTPNPLPNASADWPRPGSITPRCAWSRSTRTPRACGRTSSSRPSRSIDRGAMVTVLAGDGIGYAATSDLSDAGLRAALDRAAHWARLSQAAQRVRRPARPAEGGRTLCVGHRQAAGAERRRPLDLLMRESKACRIDDAHRRLGGEPVDGAQPPDDGGHRRRRNAAGTTTSRSPRCTWWRTPRAQTQTRSLRRPLQRLLPAGRVRGDRALGLRRQRPRDRRRGAAAARGTQLPERPVRRAADARPDDAADPRVDRPSARTRPHPRRRAQLRRHQLRHARHVRHLPYGSSC